MAGMNQTDESIPGTHGGIYRDGPFEVEVVNISSNGSCSPNRSSKNRVASTKVPGLPAKPLVVALPKDEGEYAVVQFQHGFTLQNSFYSQLISHIASHGFIVVAPQMYTLSGSDAMVEIEEAAAILTWMPTGLIPSLPNHFANHKPNFTKVALVGHSRGGKVVFGLALGLRHSALQYSAIVGLDPVDGTGIGAQTNPHPQILPKLIKTVCANASDRNRVRSPETELLFPPCAPEGVSHKAFYFDSAAPSFHLVASQHGHMDFLDDDCGGVKGKLTYGVCKNGLARKPMRRFTGGIVVAFMQAAFFGESESLESALDSPELAPVPLERPEWKGKLVGAFDRPAVLAPAQ